MKTFHEGWFWTFYEQRFCLYDPQPAMIDLRDIVHSLSLINRFNGHIVQPYSVAQHLIGCVQLAVRLGCSEEIQKEVLIHDFSEAYYQDVMSPIKDMLGIHYKQYEMKCQRVINTLLLKRDNFKHAQEVKYIDRQMLIAEARDVAGHEQWWEDREEPDFNIHESHLSPEAYRSLLINDIERLFGHGTLQALSRPSQSQRKSSLCRRRGDDGDRSQATRRD